MTKGAKWKTLLVTIISCLLITAIFYPITIPVDEELNGIMISGSDKKVVEPVQVKISGQCDWKLFGKDAVMLSLQTKGDEKLNLFLSLLPEGSCQYTDADGKRYEIRGNLNYLPFQDLGEVMIQPITPEDGTSFCLVVPASDRDSALEIIKKLAPEQYDSFVKSAS